MEESILLVKDDLQFTCEHISDAEGFEFPEIRSVFVDPPSRDGSLYINSLAGRRNLAWRGVIKENIQVNRRALAEICQPNGLLTIKTETCDGVAVQIDALVTQLLNPYKVGPSIYQIQAVAPYPYFEGQTLRSQNSGITVIEGGTPIPAAIPAPIAGGSSLDFVLTNAGNVNASPILTVRGPGTRFIIQNIDTGVLIDLDLTLTENETVIIDTKQNTVFQGNVNVFGSLTRTPSGIWLTLRPGDNRIVFNAQSGTNANTRLTVQWRDTYGGI